MGKLKIEAAKTAIVLIEPQYDFLKPGGSMYQFIAEQLEKRKVIPNLVNLLTKARGKVKTKRPEHISGLFIKSGPGGTRTPDLMCVIHAL